MLGVDPQVASDKLLSAGFIEEAHYTTWLSNVVLVKKVNDKWWMCVDYTNLNKACPRDAYPLPNIDRLIDGVAGNKVLSFLDAYSCYNQIPMATSDMSKTAFIIDDSINSLLRITIVQPSPQPRQVHIRCRPR